MNPRTNPIKILSLVCLLGLLAACTPAVNPATVTAISEELPNPAASIAVSYSDPFDYCTAVGSIDRPDALYTGQETPEVIVRALMQASGAAADAPLEAFQRGTFWRCMDGQVYACFVGANLPCESRANTSQEATAEMNAFCTANPGSDFIPAYITGHDTIYAWACQEGTAVAGEQVFQVDAQGYIAETWYPLIP